MPPLMLISRGLALALLGLSGCGGGSSTATTGDMGAALGLVGAHFIALDLEQRCLVPVADPQHAASRRHLLTFRLIEGATATLGQSAGSFPIETGEDQHVVSIPRYYLATLELTQWQWQALAGTSPWLTADAAIVGTTAIGAEMPAFQLTYDEITAALLAFRNEHGIHLRLPRAAEWEYACRGGSTGLFAWGDDQTQAMAAGKAWVWETSGGTAGPRRVGSTAANAFGLHDLHGNVWEWTADRIIRGGSWRDHLEVARAANRIVLDQPDLSHPLVGVRVVLER